MLDLMDSPEQFRMIMGNLVNDEDRLPDYMSDLLQGAFGSENCYKNLG